MPGAAVQFNNQPTKSGLRFTGDTNGELTITEDSLAGISRLDSSTQALVKNSIKKSKNRANDSTGVVGWLNKKFAGLKEKHENLGAYFSDRVKHNLPKIFFFMIPVMALLLKMMYAKRKDLFFVDHAIFALHFHSFWFSLFMLNFLNFLKIGHGLLTPVLTIIALVYMIRALRIVYGSGRGKAIFYALFMAFSYSLSLGIVFLLDLLFIFCTA